MSIGVEAIIQARMGSERLPGKVMMDLCGKPVLWHVIERVKQSRLIEDIVVATSDRETDDVIESFVAKLGIKVFRGSESNVLSRFFFAEKAYPADAIVRITADCPLIDPQIIDQVVECYLKTPYEYVSNTGEKANFPRGLDCEVFSSRLLARAFYEATEEYEREHVTPFMYLKQDSVFRVENRADYSDMRWTLDTFEDFQLIQAVYRYFYIDRHDFYMDDIYSYIVQNPEIYRLNRHIKQKPIK